MKRRSFEKSRAFLFSLHREATQKWEVQKPQVSGGVRRISATRPLCGIWRDGNHPDVPSLLAAALVGAAHAFVTLAGMAVAVRADVDAAQFTAVLRVVVTAGRNGTVDRLVVHDAIPPCQTLSACSRNRLPEKKKDMRL